MVTSSDEPPAHVEWRDTLLILVVSLLALPFAPDVGAGPYGAINPQSLVRVVLVLTLVGGLGQAAQRLIGPRLGMSFTGLIGGFVSSSATIALLSRWARDHPASYRHAVAGAFASNVATVIEYFAILGAIDSSLLAVVAPSLGCAGVVAVLLTLIFSKPQNHAESTRVSAGRAFHASTLLVFVAVFITVSIASAALQDKLGSAGIVFASLASALVDAHATSGSIASLHRDASIDSGTAELAILVALSGNTVTKVLVS